MNTSALKPFAQYARTLLREAVERRLIYWGFEKNGKNTATVDAVAGGYTFRGKVSDDTSVPAKWNKLKAAIAQTSFDEVVEKAAYTWFNRLVAMKILSKNGYETAQLDYLTGETNTPAILERARRGQYSFLTSNEKKRLQVLLIDYEKEQEAFAILLIGYCHQHPLLNAIFGAIDDYTELLLPDDILTKNGYLHFLNTTDAISDEDYKQVELIGWLYQFYISEKKDEVFAGFKKNKKAEAKDIPAATQIFTPNWIVKFLVQNTLGRTWLDVHSESDLKSQWKYLVEPSVNNSPTKDSGWNGALEDLTFLDPAVGSGHILVEAFDVLYPMYMAEYYSPEEAVRSILEKNIFGLDLDLRAAQLAQFSVILKAAQYSRFVLQGRTLPHIYAMPQHRTFSIHEVALFLGKENANYTNQLFKALQTMEQAHNLGSIMVLEITEEARLAVQDRYIYWLRKTAANFEEEIIKGVFPSYIPIIYILTNKFPCIAANPPYMGQKNMNGELKNYVNYHYPLTKSDLFSVFMDVCQHLLQKRGRFGMINMHSWMFLSSFEAMREELLSSQSIENMLHLGPRTFDELSGEVVQNTAFVIRNDNKNDQTGIYFRLVDYKSSGDKKNGFEKRKNRYENITQINFSKISGSPIAYWVSQTFISIFQEKLTLESFCNPRQGMKTLDNEQFLKNWFEVGLKKVHFKAESTIEALRSGRKWFPINHGGGVRKWYGFNDYLVNWENDGFEIKKMAVEKYNSVTRTVTNIESYFKPGVSWSTISSGTPSFRLFPIGFLFSNSGQSMVDEDADKRYFVCALLNSKVSKEVLNVLSPTLGFESGYLKRIPVKESNDFGKEIVIECFNISKNDWDSRETSWDFQLNPLISTNKRNLEQSYQHWLKQISDDFFRLHTNEEELNRIFANIYGLHEELTPDVPLIDITILQDELDYLALSQLQKPFEGQIVPIHNNVAMEQLISYVVGCYLGRYRLDKPGLYIAHPNPTEDELAPYAVQTGEEKYFQFQIDDDAIIPFMGNNGNFTDDMLHRVKEFLTIVWGDAGLTANLNFLQQQLGKDLEDYLIKDFWKYHVKTYSKKPIYWLFASKKGAFQVLVYMHRMNAFTLAKIRSKYLIPHISWLQHTVADLEKKAATLSRAELKKLDTYRKQLTECEEYDLLLKDMADKQISFDLDDGVTKNYALFEGVVAEIR